MNVVLRTVIEITPEKEEIKPRILDQKFIYEVIYPREEKQLKYNMTITKEQNLLDSVTNGFALKTILNYKNLQHLLGQLEKTIVTSKDKVSKQLIILFLITGLDILQANAKFKISKGVNNK